MKILWINPIGTDAFDGRIYAGLSRVKRPENDVFVVSLKSGKPLHLEYYSYEALVTSDIVRIVRGASEDGFSAAVIGCFFDTALRESREVSGRMIVVGPCQASLSTAVNFGNTFSVLVGRRKWIPRIEENVLIYGYERHLVSIRSLNLTVDEIARKRNVTIERMIFEGRKAIEEDGAEVLVLGCTAADDYVKPLQHELMVPVIDSFVTPFKYAEMLSELSASLDVFPSRVLGSSPPPLGELDNFLAE